MWVLVWVFAAFCCVYWLTWKSPWHLYVISTNPADHVCLLKCAFIYVFLFSEFKTEKSLSPGSVQGAFLSTGIKSPGAPGLCQKALLWPLVLQGQKKWSALPGALPLSRLPQDRHLRSPVCPALEAPALSVQRTLQPPVSIQVWSPGIWLWQQGQIHQSHSRKHSDVTDHQLERLTSMSESCCHTRLTGFQPEAKTLDISFLMGSLIKCKCRVYGGRCPTLKAASSPHVHPHLAPKFQIYS